MVDAERFISSANLNVFNKSLYFAIVSSLVTGAIDNADTTTGHSANGI